MSFDLPIAERRLKNTARLVQHSMWLLFFIAAGLMMVVRRSVPVRTGSIWILGCAVLAFMLSFALRDVLRKVGHRNTEDKIVKDVKTFLESEPAHEERRTKPAMIQAGAPAADACLPSKSAGFVPLKGAAAYSKSIGEPVVFDAIPSRETVAFKMDFYAVLQPVALNC
jgi:hypothetical protein